MNFLKTPLPITLRKDFKSDSDFVDKILKLTRASYLTNEDLIQREIEHNSDIYFISDEAGELLAFFMVNCELVNGDETYYLGLSACHDELKGQGLGKSLYSKFMSDCRSRQELEDKKYLLWWTTATPIVYYWFNKNVSSVQPDMSGKYNEEGARIAEIIKKEKFLGVASDIAHPFILRKVAENTTYSVREQERLALAAERLNMDVFQKFNLKEEHADRFLMIGYAPE